MTYTPQQLMPLAQAVAQVVLGVIGIDGSGPISGAREVTAALDFLKQAPERFAGNELVAGLVAALNSDGEANPMNSFMNLNDLDFGGLFYRLHDALGALNAGDELHDAKVFIYELAQHVAEAAGAGLFGGGVKVTEQETQFLDGLRQTLGF